MFYSINEVILRNYSFDWIMKWNFTLLSINTSVLAVLWFIKFFLDIVTLLSLHSSTCISLSFWRHSDNSCNEIRMAGDWFTADKKKWGKFFNRQGECTSYCNSWITTFFLKNPTFEEFWRTFEVTQFTTLSEAILVALSVLYHKPARDFVIYLKISQQTLALYSSLAGV